jgi:peptidoglycan/LPS O-acetylase OafA/YrhL
VWFLGLVPVTALFLYAGVTLPIQKNIQVLDSLRGLLAVVVALHHAAIPFWGSSSALIKNSYLFVDFFFILSGFVLAHGYAGRVRNARDLGNFLALRFFRLWPLHFVTLCAMALCWWLLPRFGFAPMTGQEDVGAASFTAMALLSHAMGTVGSYPLNWPSWSIAAEFTVYTVFAFLCVIALGNRMLRLLGGALFCALGVIGSVQVGPEFGNAYLLNITQWGVFRAFTGFFIGMMLRDLLYLERRAFYRTQRAALGSCLSIGFFEPVGQRGAAKTAVPSSGQARGHAFQSDALMPVRALLRRASPVEAVVAVMAVAALCLLDTSTQWVWAMLPVFALVIAVFAFEAGQVSQWLRHPALLALGRWSFSIYLVHLGIAKFVSEFVFPHVWGWAEGLYLSLLTMPVVATLCAVFYLGIVILLAAFTYKAIEMPAMGWARRRFSVPSPVKKAAVAGGMVYRAA